MLKATVDNKIAIVPEIAPTIIVIEKPSGKTSGMNKPACKAVANVHNIMSIEGCLPSEVKMKVLSVQ